jgi:hypothetical protein
MVGYWTTDEPRYHGRFLEMNQAYVIIGAGENGTPGVQTIDRVESAPMPEGTRCTIYSTTRDGVHDQLTIDYDSHNGGEVRFENQPDVVWRRAEKGTPDKPAT